MAYNELKESLEIIKKHGNYKELLESIFELNFKHGTDNFMIGLNNNISISLNINSVILIGYMDSDEVISVSDVEEEDKEIIEFINLLKDKYKYFLRKAMEEFKNPFGLGNIQSNIGAGSSHNPVVINRCDGEKLTLSCTGQDLVNLFNAISFALKTTLDVGVYNLQNSSLDELLENNNELNSKVKALLNRNDG